METVEKNATATAQLITPTTPGSQPSDWLVGEPATGCTNSEPAIAFVPIELAVQGQGTWIFWIQRPRVTEYQYQGCVNEGKCNPLPGEPTSKDQKPITSIPYDQAVKFAEYLKGRLPTTDEWETACGLEIPNFFISEISPTNIIELRLPEYASDPKDSSVKVVGPNCGESPRLAKKGEHSDSIGFRVVLDRCENPRS